MRFQVRSLQQRLSLFLLLPVAVFLIIIGAIGFVFIRNRLFSEWQQGATLRLERAAHSMDMRLSQPIQWIKNFGKAGSGPKAEERQKWILQQLRQIPGVSQVILVWGSGNEVFNESGPWPEAAQHVARGSTPEYLYPPGQGVVGLQSRLLDDTGRTLGKLTAFVKFDYLMADVQDSGWGQSKMACLVNDTGGYLAHSDPAEGGQYCIMQGQKPQKQTVLNQMKGKTSGTIVGEGKVSGFYRLHAAPWSLVLHAQASQILAPIRGFQIAYISGGLLSLGVILLLIRLGVNPMVSSIRLISRRASQVANGEYGEPLPAVSRDEIGQLTGSFNDMVAGLKERDLVRNTFGRYVDEEVARKLLRGEAARRLGGEKREVVILFSDIRGFTPLAESLSPEAIIYLINRHFSRMIEIIRAHHGIIVDFLGDAILAFFEPLDSSLAETVRQAVTCALEMQRAQAEANAVESRYPDLKMGIGLHAGEAVVGNIGSESRAKYGIIGAAVNLTHRIQGQAQGGEVVISEAVFQQVREFLTVRREFQPQLKGIQEPVTLYVVADLLASP